jgi:hypothetical protein
MKENLYLTCSKFPVYSEMICTYEKVEPTGYWRLVKPEGSDEWELELQIWRQVPPIHLGIFGTLKSKSRYTQWVSEYLLTFRTPREEREFQCQSPESIG